MEGVRRLGRSEISFRTILWLSVVILGSVQVIYGLIMATVYFVNGITQSMTLISCHYRPDMSYARPQTPKQNNMFDIATDQLKYIIATLYELQNFILIQNKL